MANSKVTYTAGSTGAGQTFAVTFSFINRSHVDVEVNGTSVAFTWNSDSEVAVTGTVTAGNTVLIIRVSSLTTRLVDYVDGSNLSETDLDTDSLQAFYLSQEAVDAFGAFDTGIVATDTHILVANGTKFNNVIMSGDATLANTGALTISTGAVETAMLAADAVDSTKLADNAVDSEHYTDGSIDVAHMSVNSIDSDQYVDGSIDVAHMSVNSIDSDQYVDGSIDLAHMSANSVDSDQYVDGSIDTAHIASANVTTAKIADDAITTAKVLDANITLAKIVSASATNKILGRVAGGAGVFEEVTLQTTLSSSDEAIPTSKAVRDDIVAIVNAVGGFVAIASEVTFPNAHPDPDDGAGTVVSIANAGGVVVDGSGQSTTGRTVGGTTVTITGIPATYQSATIADGLGMQVISTTTLNTYTYHKIAAKEGDTNLVATSIADVNTVAGSIANVNTTAANIAGVNSFGSRYRVASSAPSTSLDQGDLYFNTSTNELQSYGTSWQAVAISAANQVNINIVAGDVVYSEDLGSIADAITTSSGSDITTVADSIADINRLAPAAVIADMALLGTAAVVADLALLGTAAVVADLDLLATSAVVADLALLGTSAVVTDLDLLATSANVTAMSTVSSSIADVNRYANEYTIASSAPGSPSEGDLWYDSTNNVIKYHNGSSFVTIAPGIADVVSDGSPQLGAALDGQNNNLTNIGTVSGDNLQMDFGGLS